MDSFRLATFNVENLFMRYRFKKARDVYKDEDGFTINKLAFDIFNEDVKVITARAFKEVDADVVCLQEVESLPCLDTFNARYLRSLGYRHRMLIDSRDPRHIDVAVLSRFPITHVRSHRDDERKNGKRGTIFSRDCLEVDVDIPSGTASKRMTLYVNHFKSMMEGRQATHARRLEQAERVAEIVEERWGRGGYDGNFAILGDLNDYVDARTSLKPLSQHKELVNVLDRLPKADRWTHYYDEEEEYRQLDYVWLPNRLDQHAGRPTPGVMRKGLPLRATEYTGPRLKGVGPETPSASDHCPVHVDIPRAALR